MKQGFRRSQRDYSLAFKLSVVEQVEKGELTYKQAQMCTRHKTDQRFLTDGIASGRLHGMVKPCSTRVSDLVCKTPDAVHRASFPEGMKQPRNAVVRNSVSGGSRATICYQIPESRKRASPAGRSSG